MDSINSDSYNWAETDSDDASDYSDGVSEDTIGSDDIHIWATQKLKTSKETADQSKEKIITEKSGEGSKGSYKQDVRSQDLQSKSRLENGSQESQIAHGNSNKDRDFIADNRYREATSKIVLGDCQTADNNKTDQSSQFLKLESKDSTGLLCQYCSQDYRSSDAITYCIDCGLYMCASCRRYHQKFVGTRGHSVAVQQELIQTEFEEYKPSVIEDLQEKVPEDSSTSPRLDTTLTDSGRYSRPLTPPNNALCGPCQFDGLGEPATHFCQNCRIYMCIICYKFHQKLRKSYEQHSVISQWDCEDFDTFVPSMEAAKETIHESTGLNKDFFQQPHQTRMNSFSPILEPKGRFSIKMTSDPWECSVAGIDCFIDGRIVFTDENNRNVKLFSRQYQPLAVLELHGQPTDVAIVTNNKLAVFLPKESSLAFIKVHGNSLSLVKTIKTPSKYLRIASQCEEIYALCDPEGQGNLWLNILNENGNIVTFVHLDLAPSDLPLVPSIALSPAGGTVYIADKNHCIFAFGIDGRRIFKHENIEMSDITDLAADVRSIYVSCKELESIFRLSYDGQDCSQVVGKTARIASPKTVAIQGKLLFVGLCDSNNIHIYSLPEIL